ncbi:MAG: hypothetical protein ACR2QO_16670 [Acidimicrobiales bacterium]
MPTRTLVRADEAADQSLRSQRGLGRDLAAILESSLDREAPAVGLTRLLGERRQSTPSVRRFVVDVALAAIAEAFEADAIVLARRRHDGEPPAISTRLPPSWDDDSGVKFELVGQVWRLLRDGPARQRPNLGATPNLAATPKLEETSKLEETGPPGTAGVANESISIGGLHTWIGGHCGAEARLAAAVARRTPFSEREQIALGHVVRSVASAIDDEPTPLPNGSRLSVSLTAADAEPSVPAIQAIVALRGGGERRTAVAEGPDADVAIAEAALELTGASGVITVGFAGRAAVEDMSVSIVVLDRSDDAPLLGLVVSDGGCGAGPAEAVFAALAA